MTRLVFDIEQVAGLADHARNAPRNRMDPTQRIEIYGEDAWDPQPGEQDVARPALWLVKDEGIYLMSTGLYPEGHERALPGGRAAVAYAVGFDPRRDDRLDVWDRARDAVGGDDFADPLPLEWVDAAVRARAPEFVLEFTPDAVELVLPPPGGSG